MDERIALLQAILDMQAEGTTVIFYRDLETVLELLDEMEGPLFPPAPPILQLRAQERRRGGVQGDTG